MTTKTKRILIVGAGPAGSAIAIAFLQNLQHKSGSSCLKNIQVTLVDSALTGESTPVGETIPPAATPVLRRLGIINQVEQAGHVQCPGSWSLWGTDTPGFNDFFFDPEGRGYHLDRTAFDKDLLQRAKDLGAHCHPGMRLRNVIETDCGFRLGFHARKLLSSSQKTNNGNELQETDENLEWLETDFLIDASGVNAAAIRRLGVARNLVDEVISVGTFLDLDNSKKTRPAHTLIQATANGWWYGAQLPNNRAVLSFCSDNIHIKAQNIQQPENWLAEMQSARWFVTECEKQFRCSIAKPKNLFVKTNPSAILSAVVGKNWLAVGDAASSYDSMSSAGITKALLHAEIAGAALAECLSEFSNSPKQTKTTNEPDVAPMLLDYQQRVFDDFNAYLNLHQMMYRNEQRYAQDGFWQRRKLGSTQSAMKTAEA